MRKITCFGLGHLVVFLCLLLTTPVTPAQTVTGAISGTVIDQSGAIVANAGVRIRNMATGVERQSNTSESGNFVVVGLPPAVYSVIVEMAGFRTHERTGITLTANERVSLGNIEISLGTTTDAITVAGEAPKVNAESADTAAVLSSSQLNDVMVRGRDLLNILKILPGTSQTGGSESAGGMWGSTSPNISGTRSRNNNLTLDGQNASDIHLREYFAGAVSADAVGEVKVLSSTYMAEIGPNPGASVNVISKSGTRDFHGSGYWYTRHEQFNAVDFFIKRNGLTNPRYRFTNVGVTFGGPVTIPRLFNTSREKLFFFYSGEGWRSLLPTTRLLYTLPTALERNGDFSQTSGSITDPSTGAAFPGKVIPASRINAQGRALVGVMPMPNQLNTAVTGGSYNYEFQNFQDAPKYQHLLKVDYTPTSKDTFTFRPKWWQAETRYWSGLGFGGVPLTYFHYYYTKADAKIGWTRVVSPSIINEFNTSFGGAKERGLPKWQGEFNGVQRKTYNITVGQLRPDNNPYGFLPAMSFGGVNNAPSTTLDLRWPIDCGDEVLEFSDNMTLVKRGHTAKFGFYAQRTWSSEGTRATNFNGSFDFSNDTNNPGNAGNPFATAMLGNFRSYTEATAKNKGLATTSLLEWFAQDIYKMTRRLTVTYGARFSYVTPYHLREGQSGAAFVSSFYSAAKSPRLYQPALIGGKRTAFDPVTGATGAAVLIGGFVPNTGNTANGMVTSEDLNAGKYPSGWRVQHGVNIAPRLGIAYDVFGNGKTAIRTGFGIAKRMLEDSGDYFYTIGVNPPYIYTPTMYYGSLDTFLSGSSVLFASSVDSFEKDDHIPVTYNYSFGIQQDLTHSLSLDVSYVGNSSRHLMQQVNLNTVPYGARFLSKNADPANPSVALPDAFLRPYVEYANLTYRQNMGTSNYNSLQVQLNRRMHAGVQFGIVYTWSKIMGLTDQENGALNPWVAPKTWLWGPLGFDQTHIFAANYIWDLPKASKLVKSPAVKYVFDDWQVSGITTFASGMPGGVALNLSDGADISGGSAGLRPDVIASTTASDQNFYKWFNTAAFARPAKGTYGNASQRNYRGPGFSNFDITVIKNIPIHGDAQVLRLRGEFYNAFNHTQFAGVDAASRFDATGKQINATFGQVTSTRAPRVIQLSLSYRF